ncbi:MAG TPA: hypothetical protein VMW89_20355 [Desulfatiglandales bacterium]|nr:hypothetical protein [Desulfatiglandales bacterium]
MALKQESGLSANFLVTMLCFDQPSAPLMEHLKLSEQEIQAQLTILRHYELVKGHKEDSKVYLIPYS